MHGEASGLWGYTLSLLRAIRFMRGMGKPTGSLCVFSRLGFVGDLGLACCRLSVCMVIKRRHDHGARRGLA